VPPAGPLGAIVGGPVFHILGKFRSGSGAVPLVNTQSAVIGVDTAANEPGGYPVWIGPFLDAAMHTANPRTLDYVGTATWSASETPLSATAGCLVVDFTLGTGVAVMNNPLPVGLGSLIDATGKPSPQARKLQDAISTAVNGTVSQAASTPPIDSVLSSVLGGLL
jgi:hypothetical protein